MEYEDEVCNVCAGGESLPTDLIVICEKCNVAVHQSCYGITSVPEGDLPWFCARCSAGKIEGDVQCVFCVQTGGAMKPVHNSDAWGHLICAFCDPDSFLADNVKMEPIIQKPAQAVRKRLVCAVCRRQGGICIQCDWDRCATGLHATCARQSSSLRFHIEFGEILREACCPKHAERSVAPTALLAPLKSACAAAAAAATAASRTNAMAAVAAAAAQAGVDALSSVEMKRGLGGFDNPQAFAREVREAVSAVAGIDEARKAFEAGFKRLLRCLKRSAAGDGDSPKKAKGKVGRRSSGSGGGGGGGKRRRKSSERGSDSESGSSDDANDEDFVEPGSASLAGKGKGKGKGKVRAAASSSGGGGRKRERTPEVSTTQLARKKRRPSPAVSASPLPPARTSPLALRRDCSSGASSSGSDSECGGGSGGGKHLRCPYLPDYSTIQRGRAVAVAISDTSGDDDAPSRAAAAAAAAAALERAKSATAGSSGNVGVPAKAELSDFGKDWPPANGSRHVVRIEGAPQGTEEPLAAATASPNSENAGAPPLFAPAGTGPPPSILAPVDFNVASLWNSPDIMMDGSALGIGSEPAAYFSQSFGLEGFSANAGGSSAAALAGGSPMQFLRTAHLLPVALPHALPFAASCQKAGNAMTAASAEFVATAADRSLDDESCCVCSGATSSANDVIVACDGCEICVHQSCYGIASLPPGDQPWFCARCRAAAPPLSSCCLCGASGGAMKPTTTDEWVHTLCLWLTLGASSPNDVTREPVAIRSEGSDSPGGAVAGSKSGSRSENGLSKLATSGSASKRAPPSSCLAGVSSETKNHPIGRGKTGNLADESATAEEQGFEIKQSQGPPCSVCSVVGNLRVPCLWDGCEARVHPICARNASVLRLSWSSWGSGLAKEVFCNRHRDRKAGTLAILAQIRSFLGLTGAAQASTLLQQLRSIELALSAGAYETVDLFAAAVEGLLKAAATVTAAVSSGKMVSDSAKRLEEVRLSLRALRRTLE